MKIEINYGQTSQIELLVPYEYSIKVSPVESEIKYILCVLLMYKNFFLFNKFCLIVKSDKIVIFYKHLLTHLNK